MDKEKDSYHYGYFLGLAESLKNDTDHPSAQLLYNSLHSFVHDKINEDGTKKRIEEGKQLSY